ncbi:hypothetical protein [Nocardia wallacei]|uniref:Uncharacterized protein n=1 Tax=Nocardia wallacei TaxID=480035 RepID=A0A7G1KTJ0_9NOCA|nr:hypothetical protein [Nocardia wallacei]BCK58412.1 hypothetical protein NWFMUON74_61840 [Nocardia wallacei]
MALVTIEGVVNSDVCARGERHTVEWTDYLRGLARNGLIQVVDGPHDEPAKPAGKSSKRARRTSES